MSTRSRKTVFVREKLEVDNGKESLFIYLEDGLMTQVKIVKEQKGGPVSVDFYIESGVDALMLKGMLIEAMKGEE